MEIGPQPELEVGTYRHFKGLLYEVVGIDFCTEKEEWRVEYYSLDDSGYRAPTKFSRPYNMFFELVSVDCKAQPRFSKVDNTA